MAVILEQRVPGPLEVAGVATFASTVVASADVQLAAASLLSWNTDTYLARLAAASLRQGNVPSATPAAQTYTVGEASRPGTDANVGGSSGTLRSGLGTGTGTASSLVLQTPTLAGAGTGAQSYGTRLTIATAAITATVPVLLADGSAADPSLGFSGNGGLGIFLTSPPSNNMSFAASSAERMRLGPNTLSLGPTSLGFGSAVGTDEFLFLRWAANTLALYIDSATPPALVLQGASSRSGTDANVGGGNVTVASGRGTGTGTASALLLQTPTAAAAGSGAQTQTTRLTLSSAGVVVALNLQQKVGAAVASANDLVLGFDGNTFHITGTTQINLLSALGWQGGSVVRLLFDDVLTVKDNQASSGNNKKINLSTGADFTTALGYSLTLVYDGFEWYEVARAASAAGGSVSPDKSFLSPPGLYAANTTTNTNVTSGVTYALYLGRAKVDNPTFSIIQSVAGTASGGVTWTEVGIATGTPAAGAGTNLTTRGFAAVGGTYNSTGNKTTVVTTTGISAGDDVWALYGNAAGNVFTLIGMVGDVLQSGVFLSAVATRPSTMAPGTAFAQEVVTTIPAWTTVLQA